MRHTPVGNNVNSFNFPNMFHLFIFWQTPTPPPLEG